MPTLRGGLAPKGRRWEAGSAEPRLHSAGLGTLQHARRQRQHSGLLRELLGLLRGGGWVAVVPRVQAGRNFESGSVQPSGSVPLVAQPVHSRSHPLPAPRLRSLLPERLPARVAA